MGNCDTIAAYDEVDEVDMASAAGVAEGGSEYINEPDHVSYTTWICRSLRTVSMEVQFHVFQTFSLHVREIRRWKSPGCCVHGMVVVVISEHRKVVCIINIVVDRYDVGCCCSEFICCSLQLSTCR